MEGRRRRRAVDRDDVHAGQHLVEAFPIGRLQLVLDRRQHAVAVVIVDRQAEGLGAAGDRGADAAHADDAEPLAPDAAAEHPGRRPAGPFAVARSSTLAPSASRRGTASISAMVMSAVSSVSTFGVLVTVMPFLAAAATSMLSTPLPKLAISLRFVAGLGDQRRVDPVGDGRHQHVGFLDRRDQLRLRHRPVVDIQPRVEQFAHAGFDRIRQLARDDDERLFLACHCFLEPDLVETSLTKTGETEYRSRCLPLCVTSGAAEDKEKGAPRADGQRSRKERKCLVSRRFAWPSAQRCSALSLSFPARRGARRRRTSCRRMHARAERPAAAAFRQPEIRPRQLAHRPRRQLFGRLDVPEARPADGDHPGIRQLAARARCRRRGGLDQPVAAVGPPHRDRRALAEGQGRPRSTCLPMPTQGRQRRRHHRARRRSARSRPATANGAR